MGEEHAGRVEFLAVEPIAVAVRGEARVAWSCAVLVPMFRQGIADALAGEHAVVEEALLLLAALEAQRFQHEEMVLRDLADRAVGAGEERDHSASVPALTRRRHRPSAP